MVTVPLGVPAAGGFADDMGSSPATIAFHPAMVQGVCPLPLDQNVMPDPTLFLDACETIDFHAENVSRLANELRSDDEEQTAKRCFEFVRDQIKHSCDFRCNPVTCKASDVLKFGTGYCYAKSHLLCALLRANGIPTGLCYQRLSLDGRSEPFCLHGLCAVYLSAHGWYRIDPRGNREGIDAQFDPPHERLAFPVSLEGERDDPNVYVEPNPEVIRCLHRYTTWDAVRDHLPDMA